jgi:hypothetical protein
VFRFLGGDCVYLKMSSLWKAVSLACEMLAGIGLSRWLIGQDGLAGMEHPVVMERLFIGRRWTHQGASWGSVQAAKEL